MNNKLLVIFLIIILSNKLISENIKKDTLSIKANEITISALRYPEKLLEVPLAISKIDILQLQNLKGYNISEPLSNVPGLLLQERSGSPDVRVTIRGFGARGAGDRSNSGTSRGLKFYLNGFPLTEPDGRTSFDFVEPSIMTEIEVIRSNASAIWGNAAGGVVSFKTIPEFVDNKLKFNSSFGSYGFKKYTISAGNNFENGLLQLNALYTQYDGYRQNSNSDRWMFDIGYYTKLNKKSNLSVYVNAVNNKFNIPGPITKSAFDTNYTSANPEYLKRQERRDNKLLLIGVNFENYFDENNVLSTSIYANPKYLQRSERGTYRDFTRYHIGGSLNFRNSSLITNSIKNILLVGLDEQYQDGAILFYRLTSDAGRSDTLNTNKKEGANIAGFFAQNEVIFSDYLSLLLGLRYDILTYYNQDFMKLNNKEEKDFTKLSPKFGLTYRLSQYNSIYFNIGSGVEVPAGNETDPDPSLSDKFLINPLLEPITSQTYELGTKNYFDFNNQIINGIYLELAGFFIKTNNDIIPYRGGRFYFTAGETNRLGFESLLQFDLAYGLELKSAFTFMSSKYVEYKVDSSYYDKNKTGIFADYKNNKVAGIPDYFYSINLNYIPEFLDFILIGLNLQGVSSYFSDDANQYEVPSYNIINAKISTARPIWLTKYFGINLYAILNNLTDTKYSGSAFINPDLETKTKSPFYLEPGMPLNIAFGFEIKWR